MTSVLSMQHMYIYMYMWLAAHSHLPQEKLRYASPHKSYLYNIHGFEAPVGPVKGVKATKKESSSSKARGHALLLPNRPTCVTILSLGWPRLLSLLHPHPLTPHPSHPLTPTILPSRPHTPHVLNSSPSHPSPPSPTHPFPPSPPHTISSASHQSQYA